MHNKKKRKNIRAINYRVQQDKSVYITISRKKKEYNMI